MHGVIKDVVLNKGSMKLNKFTCAFLAATAMVASSRAAIIISEVNPSGSGTTTYAADWFELTNTGTSDVDITGWKVDDNSASFSSALNLNGISTIPAGGSVIFIETGSSNQATITANFKSAWFGTNVPANFQIGTYNGSSIGLSTTSDAVNIYNASGTLVTSVTFGASTTGKTFDNTAGLTGAISTLSAVGTNGAFTSVTGGEIGSPGTVPEPSTTLGALVGLALLARRRR
jgi:Lamin Tail Domain/PEP-CTERM motif